MKRLPFEAERIGTRQAFLAGAIINLAAVLLFCAAGILMRPAGVRGIGKIKSKSYNEFDN